MKTQNNTTQILPSPVKFSIYLIAVALVCFLNWNALNASDNIYAETEILEARLEAALLPVTENEIVLEEWMLEVVDGCLFAENNEPEIALENWMLEVSNLTPAVEDWMVNTETWATVEFLATK